MNINSKTAKNKNSHFISSLVNNHKFKHFSKNRKNNINSNYNSLDNNNYNQNKVISSKRIFSCNIKNNKNIKTTSNSINSNENIYTINNINKGNYFINTINNYENNNNIRFEDKNKSNKSKNKYQRILSTEPKEILKFKKHFSFDKKDIDEEEKKIKNEIKQKKIKSNKRSKSLKFKNSHTINTEFGNDNKGVRKDIRSNRNKNKCDINKLDELFLYMFIEQKYNKKKNTKENNKKILMESNKEK